MLQSKHVDLIFAVSGIILLSSLANNDYVLSNVWMLVGII